MLDFLNKPEMVVSDILSSVVRGISESETESKQKNLEELDPVSLLLAFRWIPNSNA